MKKSTSFLHSSPDVTVIAGMSSFGSPTKLSPKTILRSISSRHSPLSMSSASKMGLMIASVGAVSLAPSMRVMLVNSFKSPPVI